MKKYAAAFAAVTLAAGVSVCVSAENNTYADPAFFEYTARLNDLCRRESPSAETLEFTEGSSIAVADGEAVIQLSAEAEETGGKIFVPAGVLEREMGAGEAHSGDISLFSAEDDSFVMRDGTLMIDIESAAAAAGLYTERCGGSVTVTDPYHSGRIVASAGIDAEIPELYFSELGAEELLVSPFGTYIFQFGSAAEARAACVYLNGIDGVNAVPDITLELFENEENGYRWGAHIGWGAEFIKSDIFNRRYLEDIGVLENAAEVEVAVIDSGVDYTHPFLEGRVNTEKGYDFYNDDSDPMDDHSHGTHVAGIICDNTFSNVTVIPYKITSAEGKTGFSKLTSALERALATGADVVNLSLGSKDPDLAVKNMLEPYIQSLVENGTVVVAASGNFSIDANKCSHANIESCITVSACKENGEFDSSYSDYGSVIDVCAPGTDISSTIPGGGFGTKRGTSMAAPYAAAAAAMIISADSGFEVSEIEKIIKDNADDAGPEGVDDLYGHGLINMGNIANSMFGAETSETPGTEQNVGFAEAVLTPEGIRTKLENIEPREGGAVIAAASYKDGELFSMGTVNIGSYGQISSDEIEIPVLYEGCGEVKLFLFDSLDSLVPLCRAYVKNI